MADALEAHDQALEAAEGRVGILSLDSIQSAIGRPYSGYYRSIAAKCAALAEACVRNHGFADGNKRTAALLVLLLLERSGYEISGLGDEVISRQFEDLIVDLADRSRDQVAAKAWFALNLRRRDRGRV